jgi:hypothetical protein
MPRKVFRNYGHAKKYYDQCDNQGHACTMIVRPDGKYVVDVQFKGGYYGIFGA